MICKTCRLEEYYPPKPKYVRFPECRCYKCVRCGAPNLYRRDWGGAGPWLPEIDTNKRNNCFWNLRYITRKHNTSRRHGRALSAKKVAKIRELKDEYGLPIKAIAELFELYPSRVQRITSGKKGWYKST